MISRDKLLEYTSVFASCITTLTFVCSVRFYFLDSQPIVVFLALVDSFSNSSGRRCDASAAYSVIIAIQSVNCTVHTRRLQRWRHSQGCGSVCVAFTRSTVVSTIVTPISSQTNASFLFQPVPTFNSLSSPKRTAPVQRKAKYPDQKLSM